MFPHVCIYVAQSSHSYHFPLGLHMNGNSGRIWKLGPRPFQFKPSWTKDKECRSIVLDAWDEGIEVGALHGFVEGVSCSCTDELRRWGRIHIGDLERSIKKAKQKVQDVEATGGNGNVFVEAQRSLEILLHKKDEYW